MALYILRCHSQRFLKCCFRPSIFCEENFEQSYLFITRRRRNLRRAWLWTEKYAKIIPQKSDIKNKKSLSSIRKGRSRAIPPNISNNMCPLLRLAHGAPYWISGAQLGSDIHARGTFHRLAPNADSLWDFPDGYCLRHRFYSQII